MKKTLLIILAILGVISLTSLTALAIESHTGIKFFRNYLVKFTDVQHSGKDAFGYAGDDYQINTFLDYDQGNTCYIVRRQNETINIGVSCVPGIKNKK